MLGRITQDTIDFNADENSKNEFYDDIKNSVGYKNHHTIDYESNENGDMQSVHTFSDIVSKQN